MSALGYRGAAAPPLRARAVFDCAHRSHATLDSRPQNAVSLAFDAQER